MSREYSVEEHRCPADCCSHQWIIVDSNGRWEGCRSTEDQAEGFAARLAAGEPTMSSDEEYRELYVEGQRVTAEIIAREEPTMTDIRSNTLHNIPQGIQRPKPRLSLLQRLVLRLGRRLDLY